MDVPQDEIIVATASDSANEIPISFRYGNIKSLYSPWVIAFIPNGHGGLAKSETKLMYQTRNANNGGSALMRIRFTLIRDGDDCRT